MISKLCLLARVEGKKPGLGNNKEGLGSGIVNTIVHERECPGGVTCMFREEEGGHSFIDEKHPPWQQALVARFFLDSLCLFT